MTPTTSTPPLRISITHNDGEGIRTPFKDWGGKPVKAYDTIIDGISKKLPVIDIRAYQGFDDEESD